MGTGASSSSDLSTTSVVTSTEVPSDCSAPPASTTRTFTSPDVPKPIPDHDVAGVRSHIAVTEAGLDIQKVLVTVDITHPYRGDLMIQVVAPNGQTAVLSNRQGGSADNFVVTDLDITSAFRPGSAATGSWRLFVRDAARLDVGTIDAFSLTITSTK
jgi:subtilisin-like proprotein convertase family protein